MTRVDDYQLTGQIRRDLTAITDHYDNTLTPGTTAALAAVTGTRTPAAPIPAHTLDTRRDTLVDLHFWARFTMGEVRDVNGNHLQARLSGTDVPAMAAFVAHWADRIVHDHPHEAEDLADDASRHARRLKGITTPQRRDWVGIGQCPLTVARDGHSVPCHAKLRATPGQPLVTCPGCDHEDTIEWWRTRLLGHRPTLVTARDLADILLLDEHLAVQTDTIRQWVARGRISRVLGPHRPGEPWLYDWARVIADLNTPTQGETT